MAASSSSSCKSLTSNHAKVNKMQSLKPSRSCCDDAAAAPAAELCACDTFCHALQRHIINPDCNQRAQHRPGGSGTGGYDARNTVSARKIHKADREKLRRDRLNEQLLELAGALEPADRPKNDKSTILADAIQTLKDVTTEVKHLRTEHTFLSDESHDLSQEKKDLQDEKSQLKAEVERLQCQLQQQMHAMLLWMTTDPAVMMGARSFPYPVTSLPHGETDVDSRLPPSLTQGQIRFPFVAPPPGPYVPVPFLPGSMVMHPVLQAHYGYGGRGPSYFPYPFNLSRGPSEAEVPSSQIPPPIQSVSGYPLQVHHNPLIRPVQALSQTAAYQQAYAHGFSFTPPPIPGNHNASVVGVDMASSHHPEQDPDSISSKPCNHDNSADPVQHVQTALHLQTPVAHSTTQLQQTQQALDQIEEQRCVMERELPP